MYQLNLNQLSSGFKNLGIKSIPPMSHQAFIINFGIDLVYLVHGSNLYKYDPETQDFESKGTIAGFPGRDGIRFTASLSWSHLQISC